MGPINCAPNPECRKSRLWLKAVTEPNSAKPTAIAEWARAESTGKYGNVRFFDTGI